MTTDTERAQVGEGADGVMGCSHCYDGGCGDPLGCGETDRRNAGAMEGVPTWQQKAAERAAFERGVSAMRDVAVTVIRARHESGYACEPWTLVEAIRAAKEPTDPCGVAGTLKENDRG